LPQLPAQRMLAAATAEDEDIDFACGDHAAGS
jgi:hypothetical protein